MTVRTKRRSALLISAAFAGLGACDGPVIADGRATPSWRLLDRSSKMVTMLDETTLTINGSRRTIRLLAINRVPGDLYVMEHWFEADCDRQRLRALGAYHYLYSSGREMLSIPRFLGPWDPMAPRLAVMCDELGGLPEVTDPVALAEQSLDRD